MKKAILCLLFFITISSIPLLGFTAQTSVDGTIQGFNCVTQGMTCPIGKEDPMAAVERVFVLLTESNDYYFIPNVDRAVLARHINEKIRVTGEKSAKFKSIQASQIQVMKKGAWASTWERAEEEELLKEIEKLNKMQ